MKKKLFWSISVLFISLLLNLCLFNKTVSAYNNGTFLYDITDKEIAITGPTEYYYSGALVIPADIGGYPVTKIEPYAFMGRQGITSVQIPESVTEIGYNAFFECNSITKITVDSKNKNYSSDDYGVLFDKNKTILIQYPAASTTTSYTVPTTVKTIGDEAFCYAKSLVTISLPDNVSSGVETIGDSAFRDCSALTEINLPAVFKTLGEDPFERCTALKRISVSSRNSYFSSENGVLFNKAYSTLIYYPIGKTDSNYQIPSEVITISDYAFYSSTVQSVNIPLSVKTLGTGAFSNCTELKSITIPSSITSLGNSIFSGCTNLSTVNLPSNLVSLGNSVFKNCTSLESFTVPASLTTFGTDLFSNCSKLEKITFASGSKLTNLNIIDDILTLKIIDNIPAVITSIPENAFLNRTNLTSVSFASGSKLNSLGSGAFSGCGSLKSVTFDNNSPLTTIETNTFLNCTSLTSLTLPTGLTTINSSAFEGCSTITNINLPANVKTIKDKVFNGCSSLISLTIPVELINITTSTFEGSSIINITFSDGCKLTDISAFYNYSALKTLHNIPAAVTNIPAESFLDNTTIESITFASGSKLTTILNYMFMRCSSLTNIVLPDNLDTIAASAFFECTSIENIELPKSLRTIGNNVFRGCSSLTKMEIPENVNSIGVGAFFDCSKLESITLPSNLTSISENMLRGCVNLASISIPKNVISIGKHAFNGCSILGSITIPEGVTTINSSTFNGCKLLSNVILSKNLIILDNYAFNDCVSLASITLPDTLQRLGDRTFGGCIKLTDITIPKEVESISIIAFEGCTNLASVSFEEGCKITEIDALYSVNSLTEINNIPVGVTNIDLDSCRALTNLNNITVNSNHQTYSTDENGILYDISKQTLIFCPSGKEKISYTLPSTVTKIEEKAFYKCSITAIDLPDSVTEIGNNAFELSLITKIEIPANVTTIGNYAFNNCSKIKDNGVIFASGSKLESIGVRAFYYCYDLREIEIPASVKTIGDEAFRICHRLQKVSFAEGCLLDNIGYSLFEDCWEVISIENIPLGVKTIGDRAFSKCRALLEIKLPEGVTSIGERAFYDCRLLKSVNIPSGVTILSNEVFSCCFVLEKISIPEEVTKINESAFSLCGELQSVTFEGTSKLESIGANAFKNCRALRKLEIPAGVKRIGEYAFDSCYSAREITFAKESKLETIDNNVFYSCNSLQSIELPAGVKTIGSSAFSGCWSLESVNIPAGVTVINNALFFNCSALKSITLPVGILSIGENAFYNCSSLKFVHIPEATTTIDINAFNRSNAYICSSSECYAKIYADTYDINFVLCESCIDCSIHYELISNGDGTHSLACLNCGKKSGNPISCDEVIDDKIDSTCTTTGLTEGSHCSICGGIVKEQQVIKALGHNYVYESNNDGTHTGTCDVCIEGTDGKVINENCRVDSDKDVIVKATCTEEGYTKHVCEHCLYEWQDTFTDLIDHNYVYETNNDGTHTKKCENCLEETEENCRVDSDKDVIVKATCTEEGYTRHFCEHCLYEWQDTFTDLIDHNYVYEINNDGTHTKKCENCLNELGENCTIDSDKDVIVKATCTEEGYTRHFCEHCLYEWQDTFTDLIDHNYVYEINNDGTHTKKCENCLEETEENCIIDSDKDEIIEPTCTEKGYTKHICEHCSYEWQDTFTDQTNHNYGEWVSHDDGTRTSTCTICGDILHDEIVKPSLFERYTPIMWWMFLGAEVGLSAAVGGFVFFKKKNGQTINIKKILIRYAIGFGIIALVIVVCPYLVKGIVELFS